MCENNKRLSVRGLVIKCINIKLNNKDFKRFISYFE